MRRHTLSIIPSQDLHGKPIFTGISSGSKTSFEASNPRNDVQESASVVQRGVNYQGLTLEQDVQKSTDLKAYVQDLESKKIELDQLKLKIQNVGAQIVGLKSKALKDDVFSGMWKAPAERCFMWMGGFRPSVVIKIALDEMEGLTEQQRVALCGLQRQQTLRQLPLHLMNRQAAQCFLVIDEYFNRLRFLSTLWLNCTRHD
ncbi:hypothetical protein SASPL_126340 [Salvia splendens]|uniref:DOG1 domain-containing protein n=1 Tax=Salvia splendens TaxID=180675 RepID=A0A8X8XLN0_SALSN|nr:hypothetical protein SASPL_126340 [Salvia splendens]